MWLESHGNLARHPKTRRLMRRMGWTLPHTIGNLHLLWWWALDFAPTGDLSRFEPEQLTYDLDLNGATPEEFIEAMVEAGFIDRSEDSLRLHDWPDYSAKSLRPRFRRNPERWHQVLRSYGLPVITRRNSRRHGGNGEHPPNSDSNRNSVAVETFSTSSRHSGNGGVAVTHGGDVGQAGDFAKSDVLPLENSSNSTAKAAPIPQSLATRPHFGAWWSKLLELYKNKGRPMTAYEQGEVLAMLAKQPFSAVSMLKHSVKNFETSFAALPALGGRRPVNTS
jgi:hypothetical protein